MQFGRQATETTKANSVPQTYWTILYTACQMMLQVWIAAWALLTKSQINEKWAIWEHKATTAQWGSK